MLRVEHVERLGGPHCYATFTGGEAFAAAGEADIRSFFLTDFLARSFVALVVEPRGLDRHPELRDACFGQYEREPAVDRAHAASAEDVGRWRASRCTFFGCVP